MLKSEVFVFGIGGKLKILRRKAMVITFLEVTLFVALVIFIYVFPQRETVLKYFIVESLRIPYFYF